MEFDFEVCVLILELNMPRTNVKPMHTVRLQEQPFVKQKEHKKYQARAWHERPRI